MTTKMKHTETGEEIEVHDSRVKDLLLNQYEVVGEETDEDAEPTKEELYQKAQEYDVEGRSTMDKDELWEAVEAETGELD